MFQSWSFFSIMLLVSSLVFEVSQSSQATLEVIGALFWVLLSGIFLDVFLLRFRRRPNNASGNGSVEVLQVETSSPQTINTSTQQN
jgi:hypothetical protein